MPALFLAGDGAGDFLSPRAGGNAGVSCGGVVAVDHSAVCIEVRLEARPDFVQAGDSENSPGYLSAAELWRVRDRADDRRRGSPRRSGAGRERIAGLLLDARNFGGLSGGLQRRSGG